MKLFSYSLFLRIFNLTLCVDAMFSKRPVPQMEHVPAEKRLRANLADLFASNIVSGARVQSVFSDANLAHASHVADLAKAGNNGKYSNNSPRDLRRKLMKGNHWPPLYYAKIRLYDLKRQRTLHKWLPMLLPHEMLSALAQCNDPATLTSCSHMCAQTKTRLEQLRQEFNAPSAVGWGLWGDGVPVNWDRTESYEILSMSMPGIDKLRLPITCVSKKHVVTRHTIDDIMAVIAWSAEVGLTGHHARQRHDKTRFGALDVKRKKLAGKPLACGKSFLVEIRADWSWYQGVFRYPAWNQLSGFCWKCPCTPSELRQVGEDAPWRASPLTHWDNELRWQRLGRGTCPIFSAPGVSVDTCEIDWLHCMDKGVAATFLANILWCIVPKLAGRTLPEKVSTLFGLMKQFYSRNHTENTYDNFVLTMLKQPKKGPELRGKAAQIRGLVPFVAELAASHLGNTEPEATMKNAAALLNSMYSNLSHESFDPANLKQQARKLALLCVALERSTTSPLYWRVRPKLHLVNQMCQSGNNPSDTWTYRDEDFGGAVAALTRRRGGKNSPLASAKRMLERFIIKHKLPRL